MRSKKILKTLVLTCAIGVLSSVTSNAYADNGNWTKDRIYGQDRFETANKIADEFCKTNSELGLTNKDKIYVDTATNPVNTVILANAFNYPDALCSAPLSKTLNAPVLLTHADNLTESTKTQIQKMKVKNVTIIGGETVISPKVENQLKEIGINVSRIGGRDRYETSYLIATKFSEGTKLEGTTVVSGMDWHDAMISSSGATIQNKPILLVPTSDNEVLPKYKAFLNQNGINVSYTDIYGDYKSLKSDILRAMIPENPNLSEDSNMGSFKTYSSGLENKYVSCFSILNHAYTFTLPYPVHENVFITRGDDFADSLAVAPLAAKKGSPIIFGTTVNKNHTKWDEFIETANQETERLNYTKEAQNYERFCNKVVNEIKNTMDKVTLVGGENAIPENADNIFNNIWR